MDEWTNILDKLKQSIDNVDVKIKIALIYNDLCNWFIYRNKSTETNYQSMQTLQTKTSAYLKNPSEQLFGDIETLINDEVNKLMLDSYNEQKRYYAEEEVSLYSEIKKIKDTEFSEDKIFNVYDKVKAIFKLNEDLDSYKNIFTDFKGKKLNIYNKRIQYLAILDVINQLKLIDENSNIIKTYLELGEYIYSKSYRTTQAIDDCLNNQGGLTPKQQQLIKIGDAFTKKYPELLEALGIKEEGGKNND